METPIYGPQAQDEQTQEPIGRTIYDDVPPWLLHFKDAQAAPENNPDKRIQYFTGPNASLTADQIAQDQLKPKTVQSPMLDLSQVTDVQNKIQGILDQGKARKTPKPSSPHTPGIEQLAIAALLAFQNPEKAYELIALPFKHGSQQAAMEDQRAMQDFQLGGQQQSAELKNLQDMIGPLTDAAVQRQKSQMQSDQFNAEQENKAQTVRFTQGELNRRAEMRGPGGLYDSYMRVPGMTPDAAFDAVMADPRLKESSRLENEAQTKTLDDSRDAIVENLRKNGVLLDERARNLAEQTMYLGPTIGLKVAMFWLNLEQMRQQAANQSNNLNLQLWKMQADAAGTRVKGLQDKIKTYQGEIDRLKKLQTDRDQLRVYMQTHGITDPPAAFAAIEREIGSYQAKIEELRSQAEEAVAIPLPSLSGPEQAKPPFDIKEKVKGFFGSGAPKSQRGIDGYIPVLPEVPSQAPKGRAFFGADGMLEAGNIDVFAQKPVTNPDGTVSTVRSISIGTPEGVYLIPTVVGGKVVSDKDAVAHFKKTKEHLGRFKDEKSATAFAKMLHESEAKRVKGNVWSDVV